MVYEYRTEKHLLRSLVRLLQEAGEQRGDHVLRECLAELSKLQDYYILLSMKARGKDINEIGMRKWAEVKDMRPQLCVEKTKTVIDQLLSSPDVGSGYRNHLFLARKELLRFALHIRQREVK